MSLSSSHKHRCIKQYYLAKAFLASDCQLNIGLMSDMWHHHLAWTPAPHHHNTPKTNHNQHTQHNQVITTLSTNTTPHSHCHQHWLEWVWSVIEESSRDLCVLHHQQQVLGHWLKIVTDWGTLPSDHHLSLMFFFISIGWDQSGQW